MISSQPQQQSQCKAKSQQPYHTNSQSQHQANAKIKVEQLIEQSQTPTPPQATPVASVGEVTKIMNKKNNETTLTHLTKRFVKLLNSNSERVINLNEASTRLSVAKRRIYDITNVLEGIGLLQKTSKNVTRWVDCPRESPFAAPPDTTTHINNNTTTANHLLQQNNLNATTTTNNNHLNNVTHITDNNVNATNGNLELTDLKSQIPGINFNGLPDAELLALVNTYQKLDEGMNQLRSSIEQELSAEGAYVTYHDFKSSSLNDQIVIALEAQLGDRLEVNENYQIAYITEPKRVIVPKLYINNNSNNAICQMINSNSATQQQEQQQPLQNVYQPDVGAPLSPHQLQQSQSSNSTNNSQSLDATFANTNNLIGQQPQSQTYTSASSDDGRGMSVVPTSDDVTYHDPTSGFSDTDYYYSDPTFSSAVYNTISEEEDPFRPLVPFDEREEPQYTFLLDQVETVASLFPEDNLGLLS